MSQNTQVIFKENILKQPTAALPQLSGSWLRVARACWIFLAIIGLGFLITSLPGYALKLSGDLPGHGPRGSTTIYLITQAIGGGASLISAILSLVLSYFLFRHKFENPSAMAISFYVLIYGVVMAGVMEAWGFYWVGNSDFVLLMQSFLLGTPTIALLALFPNGKIVPHWMRWVLLASIPFNIIFFFLSPSTFIFSDFSTTLIIFSVWIIIFPVTGIYAQIYRYQKVSTTDERRQTRWVMFGMALWMGIIILSSIPFIYLTNLPSNAPYPWWGSISELGWWFSISILPVSFTIAITRSQLWNINIVVNRTLVYGGLTLLTMAFYIFLVGYIGNLLQAVNQSLIAFLATGLIAILFQPLRDRIQRAVNRMMYGYRDDPVSVLSGLGEMLERSGSPEDALERITETVSRTLKLPYVAIELGDEITSFGIQKNEITRLPLKYQGQTTGYLLVGGRSPGEAFSFSDLQLLENIAHQAGAAAHSVKLMADLRHSRQNLVTTREEERRRLRRDLHDGLGPTLASLTLRLDTTRNLLKDNPEKAEIQLDELKKQTQETIQDIRGLVYDLRPPALDELGLIGAIQNFIESRASSQPKSTLEIPLDLPELPAAFEVALYRIALEGITNVFRHADANSAVIRISYTNANLILEIIDDGIGLSKTVSHGVGLTSMGERADELGGSFTLIPKAKGTHIRVHLPLRKE
jgi:signal transduction histidine kinase